MTDATGLSAAQFTERIELLPAAGHTSGDLLVLTQYDLLPPSGWLLVDTERPPPNLIDTSTPNPALVSIYRFGG